MRVRGAKDTEHVGVGLRRSGERSRAEAQGRVGHHVERECVTDERPEREAPAPERRAIRRRHRAETLEHGAEHRHPRRARRRIDERVADARAQQESRSDRFLSGPASDGRAPRPRGPAQCPRATCDRARGARREPKRAPAAPPRGAPRWPRPLARRRGPRCRRRSRARAGRRSALQPRSRPPRSSAG